MKTKIVLYSIVILLGLTALSWGAEWLGIIRFGFFEPKRENVKREVFENTKSYVEGKVQELNKYRLEYLRDTSKVSRRAIQMTVAQSCIDLDAENIKDLELRRFCECMKSGNVY